MWVVGFQYKSISEHSETNGISTKHGAKGMAVDAGQKQRTRVGQNTLY